MRGSEFRICGLPVACVGDVFNDSPHRDVRTSTSFVPVGEHGEALNARHERWQS
jgi:hypothetical protein